MNPKETSIEISITTPDGTTLNPAQIEFNKRLKALEKARAALEKKRTRLDRDLITCRTTLMPLVEEVNRTDYEIIVDIYDYAPSIKLSKRRTHGLYDLIAEKAHSLLGDPVGLTPEQEENLNTIHTQLEEKLNQFYDPEIVALQDQEAQENFNQVAKIMQDAARAHGIDLDLSDIDVNTSPEEFLRILSERMADVEKFMHETGTNPFETPHPSDRKRKPTKAALEKERLRQEVEEAKNRDLKSLFKQLAKVLHPDLETDPKLKADKESWMKRLTSAYDNSDLREMLAIEIEWLGKEADNLSKATDDKLRVYAMVLKEQCAEVKERTQSLILMPEYSTLRRFIKPYEDKLDDFLFRLRLLRDLEDYKNVLKALKARDTATRHMVNDWADHHAKTL